MVNETEDMRRARFDLQMLSASDPAASANMLRHIAALTLMVTGRRGRERRQGEPQFAAGFVLTHDDHQLHAAGVRRSGIDASHLAFDVDDAIGAPVAIGVLGQGGEDVILYGDCRLWSPATDGRAFLVPSGAGDYVGYLAFRPGQPLKLVGAPVPGGLEAGFRRAETRRQRLLASETLREAHRGCFTHRIFDEGREVFVETRRAAA